MNKRLHKWLATLFAALLLCSLLPTASVAAQEANLIQNGDFEQGTANWKLSGTSEIAAKAAKEGGYGLHVTGDGGWNDYGKTATFAVEAGAEYLLEWDAKVLSGGMYVYFKKCTASGGSPSDMISGQYYSAGSSWKSNAYAFIVAENVEYMYLEFSGSGKGEAYIDNIKLTKKRAPSHDGYVYNGDFETGEASGWKLSGTTALTAKAANGGNYGLHLVGDGGWNDYGTTNVFAVREGVSYTVSYDAKVLSGNLCVYFKRCTASGGSVSDLRSGIYHDPATQWNHYTETFTVPEGAGYVYLEFSAGGSGGEVYLDNVHVEKEGGEDPIPNAILTGGQTSVADVSVSNKALAFRFDVKARGTVIDNRNVYQPTTATVTPFADRDGDYSLVRAGALVTNNDAIGVDPHAFTHAAIDGKKVVDVNAAYLCDVGADAFSFAVRIRNIPATALDQNVYARPYYIYEVEGEEVLVYGSTKSDNYNHVSTPKTHIKVLAIGNSFSHDAMYNHLYQVLESAGYQKIVLANLNIGGCSLDTHWNNINNDKASYTYYKNAGGKWTQTNNYKLSVALAEEEWDYITIQQVSGSTGLPGTFGNLNNILTYLSEHKPNPNAKILWHMTWAYDPATGNASFADYGKDQMTMYNAILDTTQDKIVNHPLIDGIIPSGTAIQNMRTSSLTDALLCDGDGYHLSAEYGDYIASLTWYAYLSGDDVAGLAYQTSSISRYRDEANQAVMNAIRNPFEITPCKN